MATFTWESYSGSGPSWQDIGSNTIVFSGSLSDLSVPINVNAYNDGTHIGSDDPGTDQCGANHNPNIKYISSTQFSYNGGAAEALNDTNLAETECSFRVRFTDAQSVALSNVRFYTFDGTTVTNEAVGVTVQAWARGESLTSWTLINDDASNIGGDNSGERLNLSNRSAATEHIFYFAVSASPQSVGAKTQFDFGIALTYS